VVGTAPRWGCVYGPPAYEQVSRGDGGSVNLGRNLRAAGEGVKTED